MDILYFLVQSIMGATLMRGSLVLSMVFSVIILKNIPLIYISQSARIYVNLYLGG